MRRWPRCASTWSRFAGRWLGARRRLTMFGAFLKTDPIDAKVMDTKMLLAIALSAGAMFTAMVIDSRQRRLPVAKRKRPHLLFWVGVGGSVGCLAWMHVRRKRLLAEAEKAAAEQAERENAKVAAKEPTGA